MEVNPKLPGMGCHVSCNEENQPTFQKTWNPLWLSQNCVCNTVKIHLFIYFCAKVIPLGSFLFRNRIKCVKDVKGSFPRHWEGQNRKFLRIHGGLDFCTGVFILLPCVSGTELSSWYLAVIFPCQSLISWMCRSGK